MFDMDQESLVVAQKAAREEYIQKQLKYYADEYPQMYACAGRKKIREFVELTLHKAEQYNMLAEREVNGLATLMQYLGCSFDQDPLYPWARFKRFPDKEMGAYFPEPESFTHLKQVYDTFYAFHMKTVGEEYQALASFFERIGGLTFSDIATLSTDDAILDLLAHLYPERFDAISSNIIRDHILTTAQEKAIEYGLNARAGFLIFAVLQFSSGIGVDIDPLRDVIRRSLVKSVRAGITKERQLFDELQQLAARNLQALRHDTDYDDTRMQDEASF